MKERVGIYAGSFDPMTYGHLDIIRRSSKLFDKLIVATMTNTSKKYMFTYDEKKKFIEDEIADLPNVKVIDGSSQLTTQMAKQYNAKFLVRSMRSGDDFVYESGIATVNKFLDDDIETIFLLADAKYANISSSMIKEVAKFNGDISHLVPQPVATELTKRLRKD